MGIVVHDPLDCLVEVRLQGYDIPVVSQGYVIVLNDGAHRLTAHYPFKLLLYFLPVHEQVGSDAGQIVGSAVFQVPFSIDGTRYAFVKDGEPVDPARQFIDIFAFLEYPAKKSGHVFTGLQEGCQRKKFRRLKDRIPDGDPLEHPGDVGDIRKRDPAVPLDDIHNGLDPAMALLYLFDVIEGLELTQITL